MPVAIQVPNDYGFVLATATSTLFVNFMHLAQVSKWRKKSGIQYPNAYATPEQAAASTDAFTFNCAQRAHANYTESLTPFLTALLISGVQYPRVAAALGGAWSLARVFYLYGYIGSSGPKGRIAGAYVATVCDVFLKLTATYTSYVLVTGW